MEIEKSKVLIKFLLNFRQSGDVLFFLYARRLRGYTATVVMKINIINCIGKEIFMIIALRITSYKSYPFEIAFVIKT